MPDSQTGLLQSSDTQRGAHSSSCLNINPFKMSHKLLRVQRNRTMGIQRPIQYDSAYLRHQRGNHTSPKEEQGSSIQQDWQLGSLVVDLLGANNIVHFGQRCTLGLAQNKPMLVVWIHSIRHSECILKSPGTQGNVLYHTYELLRVQLNPDAHSENKAI